MFQDVELMITKCKAQREVDMDLIFSLRLNYNIEADT